MSRAGAGGHQARKRFGQNFLQDPGIIHRIVEAIKPAPTDLMVEIGPGQGAITEQLVDAVGELAVVELDRDLIPNLRISFATRTNFHVYAGDALKFDYQRILRDLNRDRMRIVGNLPYNISTPLLFHLVAFHPWIQDMHFMLQKEVVERLAAGVGDNAYGRLGIMVQYHCQVEPLFMVPPEAFRPAPRVDSAMVRLRPHAKPPVSTRDVTQLNRIVTLAFSQRRKTVRNAVKSAVNESILEQAGIAPDLRPEQITLAQYARLADLTLPAPLPANQKEE
ncbi:MAG: 16S rRNA (adenine(1518)-N(6)/adenine(1519)-N(6))-dimethyltransferase RsmA [Pseudomonadota bacterium]|nr:16S rRNA (adenine(1518)-N(6)/adenine(1519)-N(6))-dimethyltransferase [Pseudomonadales bacterium]MDY6919622.1 16S rRNA (adenine(1518)-N(6)/adenine(1519)-N(6))-dimethyltransferase RsmA [Pseudomonadota bacterium]